MLGHASAAMTLDTYADLFDDDLDAVSDRPDEVRTRRVADSPHRSVGSLGAGAPEFRYIPVATRIEGGQKSGGWGIRTRINPSHDFAGGRRRQP